MHLAAKNKITFCFVVALLAGLGGCSQQAEQQADAAAKTLKAKIVYYAIPG